MRRTWAWAVLIALPPLPAWCWAAADDAGAGLQDVSGNRLIPLAAAPAGASDAAGDQGVDPRWYCSADQHWCVRVQPGDDEEQALLIVRERSAGRDISRRALALAIGNAEGGLQPWPALVELGSAAGGGVLVGVDAQASTMYSGGGASVTERVVARVMLHAADADADADAGSGEVLRLPVQGHASIRACFSERDMDLRAGACHDEYGFDAALSLDPAGAGMPVLRYQTHANRFPAFASRNQDSLAHGRVRTSELRTVSDPACSYQRVYRFQNGAYVADQALPDCSEFTEL